ncbi:hypothetical protein [Buchnera aphidicola]|uniref:hypothetical protein n=1 Tax=Buchnera aphidicola TaxID=9 RepID=UPI003463C78D
MEHKQSGIIINQYQIIEILSKNKNQIYDKKYKNFSKNIFFFNDFKINQNEFEILKLMSKNFNIYIFMTIPSKNFFLKHITPDKKNKTKKSIENYLNICKKISHTFQSLLYSFGKNGYESLLTLLNQHGKYITSINQKKKKNILLYLKKHINNINQKHIKNKIILKTKDTSISIHACKTIYHEIEILYKNIVNILNTKKNIMIHDIIITSYNLNTYYPFIKTIFESPNQQYKIPYVICNKLNKKTKIALKILKNLFELQNNDFENKNIFIILNYVEISNKFLISEDEILILKKWTKQLNIKWGFNIKHKIKISSINNDINTWKFGINRMILGSSLENENQIWNNIIPYSHDGILYTNLVNKFMKFIFTLYKWKIKLSYPKKLKSWLPICKKLIKTFIDKKSILKKELKNIQHVWKKIISIGIKSKYQKKIKIEPLFEKLKKNIKNHSKTKSIKIGKLSFCPIQSVHTIPYKIFYILGMNNNIDLEEESQTDFNLLIKNQKYKYSNNTYKNRYIFLHIINAAKKNIYISYNHDTNYHLNEIRYSKIIDELITYIQKTFKINNKIYKNINKNILNNIIHDHTKNNLKPVQKKNQIKYQNIINLKTKIILLKKNQETKSINFQKILYFWKNPIIFFFHQQLKIKNIKRYDTLDTKNYETFHLKNVDAYKIKKDIIKSLINNKNTKFDFELYKKRGNLPNENFDILVWEKQKEQIELIYKKLSTIYQTKNVHTFKININNINIFGNLSLINTDRIIRWKVRKLYFYDALQIWIEHLIYCILGGKKNSIILGYPNIQWKFKTINPALAYIHLNYYIEGYLSGLIRPIPLIKSGIIWVETIYGQKTNIQKNPIKTMEVANKKLLNTWNGKTEKHGEKNNPYIQKIIPTLNEKYIQIIKKTCKKWMLPILNKKIISTF